jgi:hypothetical protein
MVFIIGNDGLFPRGIPLSVHFLGNTQTSFKILSSLESRILDISGKHN